MIPIAMILAINIMEIVIVFCFFMIIATVTKVTKISTGSEMKMITNTRNDINNYSLTFHYQ